MAIQIMDDAMTLEAINRVVATTRFSQHAAACVRVARLLVSAEKGPLDLLLR